jgi:hypothetical protein
VEANRSQDKKMSINLQSDEDIDSALERTINNPRNGLIDDAEAGNKLRAIQKRLRELKRMNPEDRPLF